MKKQELMLDFNTEYFLKATITQQTSHSIVTVLQMRLIS